MGAEGLDLQKASVIMLLEPFLDPRNEQQVIGRAWRGGQVNDVLVYKFYSPDDDTEKAVRNKADRRALLEASTHTKLVEEID